ncbi:MAG: hypothetical protein HY287_12115 [Planctomycetes bacterium]|nr:hypothetical protein [Planctomycetota bacterium]MBI3835065.1 hypothetical protein [Planctomycetota bacterium]
MKNAEHKLFPVFTVGFCAVSFAGPRSPDADLPPLNPAGVSVQQSVPLIETTGFELPDFDAYTPGQSNFVCGQSYWTTCQPTPFANNCTGNPVVDVNCCVGSPNPLNGWHVSISSQHCHEPHIDTVHPASGAQHLRFQRDPAGGNPAGCVGFDTACRVSAFTPDTGPQGFGPTTISFDLSISNTGGPSLEYFTIGSDGQIGTLILFGAAGVISIFDASLNQNVNVGQWLAGAYHSVRIEKAPFCARLINYYYDNQLIYSTASGQETPNVERAIFQTDNGGGTSDFVDVDNYLVQRFPDLCHECGDGVLQLEECDPSAPGVGGCPPGRCAADCTCTPICTMAAPCVIKNGTNGPFVAPFDPVYGGVFYYQGTTPNVAFDTCDSTDDTVFYAFDNNDPNPQASPVCQNDDCCTDPNLCDGTGADSNASCFNGQPAVPGGYNSCSCCSTAMATAYLIQLFHTGNLKITVGKSITWNVEKKTICGGEELGSCCINNGPKFGCVDDVPQAACVGSWNAKKCTDITCVCVPNCAGKQCGDDGCGGSCGACNDGVACTVDACADGQCTFAPNDAACDDHHACDGVETCGPSGCVGGTPVNCDDGVACTFDFCTEPLGTCQHGLRAELCDDGIFCNGVESCTLTGCVSGAPPCATDEICDEAARTCSPRFTPIPTVSQWGLIVIGLTILVIAKRRSQRDHRQSLR